MEGLIEETRRTYDRPIGAKEAAAWLGISLCTLLEFCRTGQIPAVKRGGRWYFSRKKLADWAGVDE